MSGEHPSNGGPSWEDLYARGSYADALGYATVLWPSFEERDGMTFVTRELAPSDLGGLARTLREVRGDRSEVERRYNRVEVSMFFAPRVGVDEGDEEKQLARLLTTTWKAKLAVEFPDRSFVVETFEEDSELSITFHESR